MEVLKPSCNILVALNSTSNQIKDLLIFEIIDKARSRNCNNFLFALLLSYELRLEYGPAFRERPDYVSPTFETKYNFRNFITNGRDARRRLLKRYSRFVSL